MRQILMLVISGLLLSGITYGQSFTRLHPKAGISIFRYPDEIDLQEGVSHPAFHIGFDVSIQQDNWVFTPGFFYHRIGIQADRLGLDVLFSNRRNLHYAQMPFSIGRIFKAGKLVEVIPYLGPDLLFFLSSDKNPSGITNPDLTSFQAGGRLGGQVRLAEHYTFDVAYHYAFMPSFRNREKSRLRGCSFSLGYLF